MDYEEIEKLSLEESKRQTKERKEEATLRRIEDREND